MVQPVWDVVIVGGSVAGLMCGLHCARRGLNTLILERKKEIGTPVQCAEGVVQKVLTDNGFDINPNYRYISSIANRVRMFVPVRGMMKEIRLNMKHTQGIILDREQFEKYLAEEVTVHGGKILLRTRVIGIKLYHNIAEVSTHGMGTFYGKVLVGADGMNSLIGQSAGLTKPLSRHDYAHCVQYTIEHPQVEPETIAVFWNHVLSPNGYIWIFPKGDHRANVGVGILADTPPEKFIATRMTIKDSLDTFINWTFPKAKILRRTGGLVPLAKPLEHIVKDNVLIVGDAALFCQPMHGGGIGNALLSGRLAGETIADHIQNRYSLMEYERRIKAKIYKKLERGYRMKEKVMCGGKLNRYYYLCKFLVLLHRIFPKFIEEHAFARIRY